MQLRDQVMYFQRPAWIVGVRYDNGKFYDLSRKPDTHKADWHSVPEKHIKPIHKPEINEVLEFVAEANRLKKSAERYETIR